MLSLHSAYKKAKKYAHDNWWDNTQLHLADIWENDNSFLFSFYTFIPNSECKDFSRFSHVNIAGIDGIQPVYFGGWLDDVIVDKENGECEFLEFSLDEAFYEKNKYVKVNTNEVFKTRISKGKGFVVVKM